MSKGNLYRGKVSEDIICEDGCIVESGVIVEGYFVMYGEQAYIIGGLVEVDSDYIASEYWYPVDDVDVSIGIKDDEDKLIFVNDIVVYSNENGIFIGTIAFSDGVEEERLPLYTLVDVVEMTDDFEEDYTDFYLVVGNTRTGKCDLDIVEKYAKFKSKSKDEDE